MNLEERFKALEEQVNVLKEQVAKLINQNSNEIKVDPINIKYWEYIGNTNSCFTKGKVYQIIDSENIYSRYPFIDNDGDANGFYNNLGKFSQSTEEAYLAQQKTENECVHITTNEEYLFVISKFNPSGLSENLFQKQENLCIYTIHKYTGGFDCILDVDKEKTKILSFSEWCKKYNHEEPKWNQGFMVGDYSDKPLLLEVSDDKDFKYFRIKSIHKVFDCNERVYSSYNFKDEIGDFWEYARKIDLDKYQI